MSGRFRIGRNDSCWCGSGRKYKKCHLGRDKQPESNPHAGAAIIRKRFNAKTCLHPLAGSGRCGGQIVRAHSVRRSADLESLSRDGHVYYLHSDLTSLTATGGKPLATLIGINKASTFGGFCAEHDRTTFGPLEIAPFVATQEQCFLLFYRAWARETYMKQAFFNSLDLYRDADKGRQFRDQLAMQSFVSSIAEGVTVGLEDILFYKHLLDGALLSPAHDTIKSLVIWFETTLDVVCSGATYPYWDFSGRVLQPIGPRPRPAPLAATLLCTPKHGCAVLSWFSTFPEAPAAFVESLLQEDTVGDALIRFIFSACENVFARPEWWEDLSSGHQARLIDRMTDYMSPLKETPKTFLMNDGLRFTSWRVSHTERV